VNPCRGRLQGFFGLIAWVESPAGKLIPQLRLSLLASPLGCKSPANVNREANGEFLGADRGLSPPPCPVLAPAQGACPETRLLQFRVPLAVVFRYKGFGANTASAPAPLAKLPTPGGTH